MDYFIIYFAGCCIMVSCFTTHEYTTAYWECPCYKRQC